MAGKAKSEPRKSRLKVFRTAIGFHDAYVAAPSRKAALQAWGTDKDLFARGAAEEVTEPSLMEEPLGAPGTVFRQLRSMPAEEPAAQPGKSGKRKPSEKGGPKASMRRMPDPPPPQRPSDEDVEVARQALDAAVERHDAEQRDLAARERELATERKGMEARQAKDLRLLERELEAARLDYEARLEAWQEARDKARGA
jgi:hypothetical protein